MGSPGILNLPPLPPAGMEQIRGSHPPDHRLHQNTPGLEIFPTIAQIHPCSMKYPLLHPCSMKHLLFFLALPASLVAHGQYDPAKVSKKAIQLNAKAMESADNDDLKGAIALLKQAVGTDPNYEEAYLSMAGMYGQQKNYPAAVENYEKAKAIDS